MGQTSCRVPVHSRPLPELSSSNKFMSTDQGIATAGHPSEGKCDDRQRTGIGSLYPPYPALDCRNPSAKSLQLNLIVSLIHLV